MTINKDPDVEITIQKLIEEFNALTIATSKGDLSIRVNESKFEGGYRAIIAGINQTMEAVVQPIYEASKVMQEMTKGNLELSMKGKFQGDFAKIKEALNYTIDTFNNVLFEINNAANQVAMGSKQVAQFSQTLSQGSTEQASTIEELSPSIESITAQTKKNAENANQANQLANSAKKTAEQGNQQMREMLIAMENINEASGNISKIIKVIDEIAFQTNILALNAALEAARAGQYSKGFAVVAEEVRNLAARSANTAKETTAMIEGSIKKVESGSVIANNTAHALNEIVEGVTKVDALVTYFLIASDATACRIKKTPG